MVARVEVSNGCHGVVDRDPPERVMIAGDWHGNIAWARQVIDYAPRLLSNEPLRIILHLGDLGVWPGPGGVRFLDALDTALEEADTTLYLVDGNHDDHDQLTALRRGLGVGKLRPRVWHCQRGMRWQWWGRTWLALGGGVSLDRVGRQQGRDWWAAEEITQRQAADVAAAGSADVLLTHDCPAGVEHTFPPPPSWWDRADLDRSDAHRARLRSVVDAVRARWLFHGHLHLSYARELDLGWGDAPLRVLGLDRDGAPGNWAVVNTRHMTVDVLQGYTRRQLYAMGLRDGENDQREETPR